MTAADTAGRDAQRDARLAARLKAARAGDARARAAVLRQLQDDWFAYALANLLSISAARDAVQDAGLRVLSRLSAFDPAADGPLSEWSLGAVVTAVRDVRALNGGPPPLLAAARRAGLSADPPPFRRQVTDAADGLSTILAAMSSDQREAVVLRALDRRPTAAVARMLGAEPTAVRAAVAAGLRTVVPRPLRASLESCRDWSALARYPGDLRSELFRADRPRWLVPAAVATLLASAVALSLGRHFRPPPTTAPTTVPTTVASDGGRTPPAGRP